MRVGAPFRSNRPLAIVDVDANVDVHMDGQAYDIHLAAKYFRLQPRPRRYKWSFATGWKPGAGSRKPVALRLPAPQIPCARHGLEFDLPDSAREHRAHSYASSFFKPLMLFSIPSTPWKAPVSSSMMYH